MKLDQTRRIQTLAMDTAILIHELREDRATAHNKATIRGVLVRLERAHSALNDAAARATQRKG